MKNRKFKLMAMVTLLGLSCVSAAAQCNNATA